MAYVYTVVIEKRRQETTFAWQIHLIDRVYLKFQTGKLVLLMYHLLYRCIWLNLFHFFQLFMHKCEIAYT